MKDGPGNRVAGSARRLDHAVKPGPFLRFTVSRSGRVSLRHHDAICHGRLSRFEIGTIVHPVRTGFQRQGFDLPTESASGDSHLSSLLASKATKQGIYKSRCYSVRSLGRSCQHRLLIVSPETGCDSACLVATSGRGLAINSFFLASRSPCRCTRAAIHTDRDGAPNPCLRPRCAPSA